MPSLDITDDHHERITALREELADAHADSYTSVTLSDTVAYLLDLADAVDDPERQADIETVAVDDDTDDADSFPRAQLEARLQERNRRHSDSDPETPMDLYDIAAEYDVSGRSNMTKQELIEAILDATQTLYTDPFAPVDIESSIHNSESKAERNAEGPDNDNNDTADGDNTATESPTNADETDGDSQLDAMLSLLETHSDKWSSADGDARYEVELPDGTVESARTKDDVRATLFKHY